MDYIKQAKEQIMSMTPEKQEELMNELNSKLADLRFIPNAGPQTEAYFSPADELLYGGSAGCVSGDTEFMTPEGWKRIDEYKDGDLVGMIDPISMDLSFAKPEAYIDAPCESMVRFFGNRLSMMLSDEHKMLLWDYEDKLVIKRADEVEKKPSRYKVPVNFKVHRTGLNMSDDILRMAVAIHADGNLTYRKDGSAYCRISLRKQRKIDRLLSLFKSLNIVPHVYNNPKRPTEVRYGFDSPILTKTYEVDWYNANQRQLEIILEEMSYWDGNISGTEGGDICFSSINKCDIDFMQYAAHSCGRVATISTYEAKGNASKIYKLHVSHKDSIKSVVTLRVDTTNIERIPASRKYCFTLPTGFWLARHDNKIFITGNSGKSGLILGLAFTQHKRSLIMRRKYTDLDGLTEDAMRLFGDKCKLTGGSRPKIKTDDNRSIDFGAARHEGDEQSWQGVPHDLICFDELSQFTEYQYKYLQTWLRTVEKGQRTRIIGATNPPTSVEGEWVIKRWAAWLDPTHPNPAKAGELRWYVTDPDGKDIEVPDDKPVHFPGRPNPSLPKSRTFIPGKVADNPYLGSDYVATLDTLPEPLRSAMRDGNFMMSRKDVDWQTIPTAWVDDAIARWHKMQREARGTPMCAIGVDVCQAGGNDNAVLARRYDGWYDELISVPGSKLRTEDDITALILKHRRDGAEIIIDSSGGYGTHTFEQLKSNGIDAHRYIGKKNTDRRSTHGRFGFPNTRSAAYWLFREALDPSQPGGSQIALPSDMELRSELTAPTYELTSKGFKIENKEDVKDKLGRSPDKADAVVMAWWMGKKGLMSSHPSQVYGKMGLTKHQSKVRVITSDSKRTRRGR